MSTWWDVIGVRPPDEKWQQMKAIYDACAAAGVEIPQEVDDFFNGEKPDPDGIRVSLEPSGAVTELENEYYSGKVVELAKLPKNITHLRFFISW